MNPDVCFLLQRLLHSEFKVFTSETDQHVPRTAAESFQCCSCCIWRKVNSMKWLSVRWCSSRRAAEPDRTSCRDNTCIVGEPPQSQTGKQQLDQIFLLKLLKLRLIPASRQQELNSRKMDPTTTTQFPPPERLCWLWILVVAFFFWDSGQGLPEEPS